MENENNLLSLNNIKNTDIIALNLPRDTSEIKVNKSRLIEEYQDISEIKYDDVVQPFKIGKKGLSGIMQKYLTRKFTEDIDFLHQQGGANWLEDCLLTNKLEGIKETDYYFRISVFDSNENAPDPMRGNLYLILRFLLICVGSS